MRLCMKRPAIGKAGIEYGFHMAARNMVMNAVFAAVQELDYGSKGIDRYALIAFLSSSHAGTKRNAINFPIMGGSNDRDGFFYDRACADIAEPEIAKSGAIPENQAAIDGISPDL